MGFMQWRSEEEKEEKDYYPGTHHQYHIGISDSSLGFTWYWIGEEISCTSPLTDGPLSESGPEL